MDNSGFSSVRIETMSRRGLFWTGAAFVGAFLGLLAIGASGPDVFRVKDFPKPLEVACPAGEEADCHATWVGTITDMQREHQLLYVSLALAHPDGGARSLEFDMSMVVEAWGSEHGHHIELDDYDRHSRTITCDKGEDYCDSISVFSQHFVQYHRYHLNVTLEHPHEEFEELGLDENVLDAEFELVFIDMDYTAFEMGFKYTFLVLSLVVALAPRHGFFVKMRRIPQARWSYEQKWAAALLAGLVLFNDPLFALEIYDNNSLLWTGLYVIWLVGYFALLLLFWLCIIDQTRCAGVGDTHRVRGMGYYMPKVMLLTAFWFSTISIYMYTRLKQEGDPSYDTVQDLSHFTFFKVVAIFLTAVYALWLLYYVARALGEVRRLAPPFFFVFLVTMFTIVVFVVGLFAGALAPIPSAAVDFLLFYGLVNIYVWVLAYAYAPAGSGGASGHSELGEDEDDEEEEMVALELTEAS